MSFFESSEPQNPTGLPGAKPEGDKPDAPPWMRYVALLTGVLAGLGGFLTVRGTSLTNDAIYRNTKAVLYQAQASDSYNEMQADSLKKHMAEIELDVGGATLSPEVRKKLEDDSAKYGGRETPLKQEALEREASRDLERSGADKVLNEKGQLDIAGMAVQLGIALASVAALTRRKEAFIGGLFAGAAGAGLTAYVLIHHYLAK